MNTSSFVLVGGATILGAAAMFFAIDYGLDASDDYASELSVTSDAYLKLRAKAILLGEDATKIKGNETRSHRPINYDASLISAQTSPYLRLDSDSLSSKTLNNNFDVTEVLKNNGEILLDEDDINAAKAAGLNEEELEALMEVVMLNPSVVDKVPEETDDEDEIDIEELSDENVYTVHDEIRHQLATEEMSDEKRELLESLLPKKTPKPVRAVNVILKIDTKNCVVPRNSNSLIGVMFRPESEAIRGSSLNALDELIALRERCDGELILEDHAGAISVIDIELREDRRDEVKYYLLQRKVPVESIVLSSL